MNTSHVCTFFLAPPVCKIWFHSILLIISKSVPIICNYLRNRTLSGIKQQFFTVIITKVSESQLAKLEGLWLGFFFCAVVIRWWWKTT